MRNRLLALGMVLVLLLPGNFFALSEDSLLTGAVPERVRFHVRGDEPEDMAAGYIHKKLYPVRPGLLRIRRPAGASLTGADQALYIRMMSDIQAVASGEKTSTIFDYPVKDIYPQYQFTAEELELDTLVSGEAISEEAMAAMENVGRSVDVNRVLSCLLADAPYDLYWFDKSEETGGMYVTYPDIGYEMDDNGERIFLSGILRIEMIVAGEYAADNTGECFAVDPKYGTGVASAVANARAIVEAHEGETDYNRLLAYRNEICSRTSYNDSAADGNAAYGNPWQLVWVFDDDPETNVVCEGYAKAFQYLNDVSATTDVSVISVTGLMDGENHMWNIVNMDNGKNYMADITNCDSGTIGYPDKLFLTGYADGDAAGGYTFVAGNVPASYIYQGNAYPDEDLEIWNKSYPESLALKPDMPVYLLSSDIGYPGYRCAVQMDERYDSIHILETDETLIPDGEGWFAVSSRPMGGEDMTYTIAAEREGFTSPYGETLTLPAGTIPDSDLLFPLSLTEIGPESFRRTGVKSVILPESIRTIGEYAFADNPSLEYVQLNGQEIGQGAFDNCPQAVFCIDEENVGQFLADGKQFLVK